MIVVDVFSLMPTVSLLFLFAPFSLPIVLQFDLARPQCHRPLRLALMRGSGWKALWVWPRVSVAAVEVMQPVHHVH